MKSKLIVYKSINLKKRRKEKEKKKYENTLQIFFF